MGFHKTSATRNTMCSDHVKIQLKYNGCFAYQKHYTIFANDSYIYLIKREFTLGHETL